MSHPLRDSTTGSPEEAAALVAQHALVLNVPLNGVLLGGLTKKARNPPAQTPDVEWRGVGKQMYYK